MPDAIEVIIIMLSALTAAVWIHSLMAGSADTREEQPVQRTVRLYHGEAMLGVEESIG
jgi:hypothetical protein